MAEAIGGLWLFFGFLMIWTAGPKRLSIPERAEFVGALLGLP